MISSKPHPLIVSFFTWSGLHTSEKEDSCIAPKGLFRQGFYRGTTLFSGIENCNLPARASLLLKIINGK